METDYEAQKKALEEMRAFAREQMASGMKGRAVVTPGTPEVVDRVPQASVKVDAGTPYGMERKDNSTPHYGMNGEGQLAPNAQPGDDLTDEEAESLRQALKRYELKRAKADAGPVVDT